MKSLLIALAITLALPLTATQAHTESRRVTKGSDQSHAPCRHEDGPGPCFWNSDSRGNQKGRDFHLDRAERLYIPFRDMKDHRGKNHDACWIHIADTSLIWCEDGYRTSS